MIHILICVIIGNALISDDQFDPLENNLMRINPVAITLLIKKLYY